MSPSTPTWFSPSVTVSRSRIPALLLPGKRPRVLLQLDFPMTCFPEREGPVDFLMLRCILLSMYRLIQPHITYSSLLYPARMCLILQTYTLSFTPSSHSWTPVPDATSSRPSIQTVCVTALVGAPTPLLWNNGLHYVWNAACAREVIDPKGRSPAWKITRLLT